MIYRQEQHSRRPCLVVNRMMEPRAKDDRDVDNIASTLEKETGIGKDIIPTNIDKTHPIGRVENGKQLRIVKFGSDHFKEVICKKHQQRKKDNVTKHDKNNQSVKVPINLQSSLAKYRFKLLQFAGEKFEDIR